MNDSKSKNSKVLCQTRSTSKEVCELKTSSISSLNALEFWHDLVRKNGFLLKIVEKSSKIAQAKSIFMSCKGVCSNAQWTIGWIGWIKVHISFFSK